MFCFCHRARGNLPLRHVFRFEDNCRVSGLAEASAGILKVSFVCVVNFLSVTFTIVYFEGCLCLSAMELSY